jgi:hypothetical protein
MSPITEILSPLLQRAGRALGSIVCIGAGTGADLAALGALRPRRLVLVEGDPEAAAEIEDELRGRRDAQLIRCAVSATGGAATWHTYSLPRFNGLSAASERLRLHYPRLRTIATASIQTTPLHELLGSLDLAQDASHLLVLDAPGSEDALLGGLSDDALRAFEWIVLRGCAEPLFAGAQTAAAALQRLEDRCFTLIAGASASSPLWPLHLLHQDQAKVENRRLEQRLAELTAAARERDAALATLRAGQIALTQAHDEQMQLAAELRQQLEQVTKARDEQSRLATDRQAQLQKLAAERDRLATQGLEGGVENDRLRRSLRDREREITRLQAVTEDSTARQRLLDEELTRATAQIDLIRDLLLKESQL